MAVHVDQKPRFYTCGLTMIDGGYILIARKIFGCNIMSGPPLYFKLWVWMLNQANWRDRDKLVRGQFVTTIDEMRKAMSYKVGYRTSTPTKDEIRSAYEAFTKTTMITTTKTTRGMIITICNYEEYQKPENYEAHNETHHETTMKPAVTPHDTEEREEVIKDLSVRKTKPTHPSRAKTKSGPSGDHQRFIWWWSMAYQKLFGSKPMINGGTGKMVSTMLESVSSPSKLFVYASYLLTTEDEFYAKAGRTLNVLYGQIDKFNTANGSLKYDIDYWREVGIAPPDGVKIVDWKFWEDSNEQESL